MLPFSNKNLIGQVLPGQKGSYKIISKLGEGGFGETYLAEDIDNNNQECVVKLLKPNQQKQSLNRDSFKQIKKLFEREAKHLNKLNHPQIPKLKDYFVINYRLLLIVKQDFYLVEEYIEGEELTKELPPSKKLDNDEVWQILHDILEILAFLHEKHLTHRDVTPANLIRRKSDGKLVLVDFGTIKDMNDNQNTIPSLVISHPLYMPIERTGGTVTFNTDVYAVGIIGIQALTGILPNPYYENGITFEDNGQITWRHLAPQVSGELADIIDKMVHHDYQQYRYNTGKDALKALKSIAPTMPVQRITNNANINVPDLIIGERGNNIQTLRKPEFILISQERLENFINTILTLPHTIDITPEPDSNNKVINRNLLSSKFVIIAGIATSLAFAFLGFKVVSSLTSGKEKPQPQQTTITETQQEKPQPQQTTITETPKEELTKSYTHPEKYMSLTMNLKKAYYIIYKAPEQQYDQSWPVVEKMIDSFEIK